jgi:hypothetical protein
MWILLKRNPVVQLFVKEEARPRCDWRCKIRSRYQERIKNATRPKRRGKHLCATPTHQAITAEHLPLMDFQVVSMDSVSYRLVVLLPGGEMVEENHTHTTLIYLDSNWLRN